MFSGVKNPGGVRREMNTIIETQGKERKENNNHSRTESAEGVGNEGLREGW
jgi:hypothetical protein